MTPDATQAPAEWCGEIESMGEPYEPAPTSDADLDRDPEPPAVKGWSLQFLGRGESSPWDLRFDGELFHAYETIHAARRAYGRAVSGAPPWAVRGFPLGMEEIADYWAYRKAGTPEPEPRPSAFEGHPATEGGE